MIQFIVLAGLVSQVHLAPTECPDQLCECLRNAIEKMIEDKLNSTGCCSGSYKNVDSSPDDNPSSDTPENIEQYSFEMPKISPLPEPEGSNDSAEAEGSNDSAEAEGSNDSTEAERSNDYSAETEGSKAESPITNENTDEHNSSCDCSWRFPEGHSGYNESSSCSCPISGICIYSDGCAPRYYSCSLCKSCTDNVGTKESAGTESAGNLESTETEGSHESTGTEGNPEPAGTEGSHESTGTEGNPEPAGTEGNPEPAGTEGNPEPAGTEGSLESNKTEGSPE